MLSPQNIWDERDVNPGGTGDIRSERLAWMAQTSGLEFGAVSGNFDEKVTNIIFALCSRIFVSGRKPHIDRWILCLQL